MRAVRRPMYPVQTLPAWPLLSQLAWPMSPPPSTVAWLDRAAIKLRRGATAGLEQTAAPSTPVRSALYAWHTVGHRDAAGPGVLETLHSIERSLSSPVNRARGGSRESAAGLRLKRRICTNCLTARPSQMPGGTFSMPGPGISHRHCTDSGTRPRAVHRPPTLHSLLLWPRRAGGLGSSPTAGRRQLDRRPRAGLSLRSWRRRPRPAAKDPGPAGSSPVPRCCRKRRRRSGTPTPSDTAASGPRRV